MSPLPYDTIFDMIFLVSSAIAALYISTRSQWFVNILLSKNRSMKATAVLILVGGILQVLSLEIGRASCRERV